MLVGVPRLLLHRRWRFLAQFRWPLPIPATAEAELATQATLLHCVFGNPYRPVPTLGRDWLRWNNGRVTQLARGIYQDRAFDRLPILADALEDAGCDDGDILGHYRSGGVHVRGCWVVDLLLGKA